MAHVFTKRGFGRIYVANAEDISTVDVIVKKMDVYGESLPLR
jgi:hypothetical protein